MLLSWANPTQTTHFAEFHSTADLFHRDRKGKRGEEKRTAQTSMTLPKDLVRNFNCKSSQRC